MRCGKQHPIFDRFADAGLPEQSPGTTLPRSGVKSSISSPALSCFAPKRLQDYFDTIGAVCPRARST
jgi:hypothetical protein